VVAARQALPLPFGPLQLQAGVDIDAVRAAFRTMGELFGSRHKTIPRELLRKFQEQGLAATGPAFSSPAGGSIGGSGGCGGGGGGLQPGLGSPPP
jgi:hypothetical protein